MKRIIFSSIIGLALFLMEAPGALAEPEKIQIAQNQQEKPQWLVPSLHSLAIVTGTRITVSLLWPNAFDITQVSQNADNFGRAWTSWPEFDPQESFFSWDHDPWTLNLIGHGLMGSEFYLRYREAFFHPALALGMTAAWTFCWEYLIEGWHKQPSGIDLLWTPTGGFLLGEGRYQLYQLIRRKAHYRGRHLLLYLLDPLGQLERDVLNLDY